MMRSMYSGVSGLRNHQTRMDVIGNNIANVNTTGYKKSRVVFKDTFYQATRGASSPTAERGGMNPMAVGLGMTLSSIDQIHTPAPTTSTSKTTDLAVDGNGYFIVKNGNQSYYTRAGAFDFDQNGRLVSTANGYMVQGWNANPTSFVLTPTGDTAGINIAGFKDLPARPTSSMDLSGNLDSGLKFTPSRNEVQTLTFPTIPNGGNQGGVFTLAMDGHTTGFIQVGANGTATASNIRAALEALPNVGVGNVSVSWDQVRGRYDVAFQDTLKNTNLPPITFAIPPAVVETTKGANPGTDEVQTLSMGGVTSGTFALTYGGISTAPIAFGANAAATASNIQAALAGIPALSGAGAVTVAPAGSNFTITFDDALGDVNMVGFTPVTGGAPAVVTLTEGQTPVSVLPTNEVQTLDLTAANGGTFTLTYGGVTSGPISFNGNLAAIQGALNLNPSLGGNVTVTQVAAPVGPNGGKYTITFNTGLAGTNVGQIGFTPDLVGPPAFGGAGSVTTTTQGQPAGNPIAADTITTSKDVYDSQGNKVTTYYRFFKYEIVPGSNPGVVPVVPPVTRWACDISLDPMFEQQTGYSANADLRSIDIKGATPPAAGTEKMTRIYNIEFDQSGNIKNPLNSNVKFDINRQVPPAGTANINIDVDFQKLTQFAATSSARVESQDGYSAGKLTSYTIATDGTIQGVYSNGETKNLARVALRMFENPGGLKQAGGSLFEESANSGGLKISSPGENGLGNIIPSSLEMSNVDLSEEFTDMIVTQRGFQANSRIITTSDEMLQELVNLKR